jgi:hypothetical protein
MQNIKKIIDSEKTVFNIQDLKNVLKIPTLAGLNSFLRRAKSNEILINICNGLCGTSRLMRRNDQRNKIRKIKYSNII